MTSMTIASQPIRLAICVASLVFAAWQAEAGTQIIHAEGRAAIAGNNIAAARQSALAEALYDAAGRIRMRVQGAGNLSTQGVLKEESNVVVEGLLKGYQVVEERREGTRYMIAIEALADTQDDTCTGDKHVDLDIRSISVRMAPGISGALKAVALASLARSVDVLSSSGTFRVSDSRNLVGADGVPYSSFDSDRYTTMSSGLATNEAGYSLSGALLIERSRSDSLTLHKTALVAQLSLKLRDNSNGATIKTIQHSVTIPLSNRVWGTDYDYGVPPSADLSPLWKDVLGELESKLGCQPLRAKVASVEDGKILLTAGSENGVREGDYFLVQLSGKNRNAWQVLHIESTTPSTSYARPMKATPAIPVNSLATLLN